MSEPVHSLLVVLERDLKSEDAARVVAAIEAIRGVLKVDGVVADMTSQMAEWRARQKLGEQLLNVIYPNRLEGHVVLR
jgi:hypothetical protein